MVTPKIVLDINNKYASMNPAMQSISDFLIKNFEKVAYMGISELAGNSGVSDATVSRYVKHMGFKNYKAFQLEMVSSLNNTESDNSEDSDLIYPKLEYGGISRNDSTEIMCKKVFRSNMQMLEDTLSILDYETIDKVSKFIMKARNVILFGVGRSRVTAESGRSRLYRLGINTFCYSDAHEQIVASSMCDERDVIIAISNYGRSKSVVQNTRRARKNGAITVGITSAINSPIAKAVEYPIYTSFNYESYLSVEDKLSYEPASENIAQIAVLDSIYMSVSMKAGVQILEKFYKTALEMEEEKVQK